MTDTKDRAKDVARQTADTIESNPLAVLAGGLAVGALVGALLPRSTREKELLAPVGQQLNVRIKAATDAAKSAGQDELQQLGLTKGAAKDQAKALFQGVAKAIGTAGSAAAKKATTKA